VKWWEPRFKNKRRSVLGTPPPFSKRAKVVSATFILAEEADFAGMNEEWLKWFAVNPPARQGAKLPIRPKGMNVSVAVIAEA
jgi:hypothetical protein